MPEQYTNDKPAVRSSRRKTPQTAADRQPASTGSDTPAPAQVRQGRGRIQQRLTDTFGGGEQAFRSKTGGLFSVFTKTVGRKISLGYVLAVVLTVTIGAISYSSITSLNQTAEWVDHTHVVLAELERITSGLKDAETGQRGFLITNLDNYLEPYNTAGAAVAAAVAEVRDLTSDNPVQQGRLDDLEPLIAAKFDDLQETIDLRRDAGFDAALAVVLTDKGKAVMDNIRALIGEMSSEEADLLVIRDADAIAGVANAAQSTAGGAAETQKSAGGLARMEGDLQ